MTDAAPAGHARPFESVGPEVPIATRCCGIPSGTPVQYAVTSLGTSSNLDLRLERMIRASLRGSCR
jgi:hypothetical protein